MVQNIRRSCKLVRFCWIIDWFKTVRSDAARSSPHIWRHSIDTSWFYCLSTLQEVINGVCLVQLTGFTKSHAALYREICERRSDVYDLFNENILHHSCRSLRMGCEKAPPCMPTHRPTIARFYFGWEHYALSPSVYRKRLLFVSPRSLLLSYNETHKLSGDSFAVYLLGLASWSLNYINIFQIMYSSRIWKEAGKGVFRIRKI